MHKDVLLIIPDQQVCLSKNCFFTGKDREVSGSFSQGHALSSFTSVSSVTSVTEGGEKPSLFVKCPHNKQDPSSVEQAVSLTDTLSQNRDFLTLKLGNKYLRGTQPVIFLD
jgi:hypothetical protein